MKNLMKLTKEYGYYVAFLIAFASTAGSLFFSEVMQFPPCVLCWYQRICMYPLVLLFGIGIWKKDTRVWQYALPLSVIGTVIGIYHNLLYYEILPEAAAPCIMGISCTTKFIEWLGFITIPLLSLMGFGIITFLLLAIRKAYAHDKRK